MKKKIRWVLRAAAEAAHAEALNAHGGLRGIRDENALESALVRPAHKMAYGNASLADVAAAYAFGLVKNHPFNDGNKRTALIVTETFLRQNGQTISASQVDVVEAFLLLADGALTEREFARWLSLNTQKL